MKRALMFASVASMVYLFNRDNIQILEDLGYKVTVACNFSEGNVFTKEQARNFMAELKVSGYDVINVPVPRSLKDIKGFIKSYFILKRDMKKKNYQLIHTQSPIGGVICRLASAPFRKKGAKVLYYAHGFHFFKGAEPKNWLMYYPVELLMANFTDVVLTLNKEDYNRALKHFNTRVEYIPGVGLELDDIRNTTGNNPELKKAELGIPADKKVIVSVCELSARKNCEVALKAFAAADRDDAVLLFCGIGEQKEMLEEMAYNLGVGKSVIFAGFRNDIIEILKMSDVFIFSSMQEGLPVAIMEAMACGLPVLCSRIRGNVELVKNKKNGYLFKYYDVKGFEKGIVKLLDDDNLRKKMGDENRLEVQKYDRNAINEMMKDIYISLGEE